MPLSLAAAPPVTIEEALGVLEKDQALHMTTDAASERDLDVLEEALGCRLPEEFRTLLVRLGGGIFYERHELFGVRRLMIHDIELVPDLLSFRRRFVDDGGNIPSPDLVPFHRADGVVHLLDLRGGSEASVISADGERSYPDLACFLQQVVIPKAATARP